MIVDAGGRRRLCHPGPQRGEVSAWDPVNAKTVWSIKEQFPAWSGTVVTAGDAQLLLAPGQAVGVTQVGERIWLVTFMHYDLGYFDDETCRLEPIENPFGPKVLPM